VKATGLEAWEEAKKPTNGKACAESLGESKKPLRDGCGLLETLELGARRPRVKQDN